MKDDTITQSELSYLTTLLDKSWNILDLACGYGRYTIPLAEMGFRISGIDITPDFIQNASEAANLKGLSVDFRVGDMRNLPYQDESFDAVLCMWNSFSEMTTLKDQQLSIREMGRVLKPEGMALIEVRNHLISNLEENPHVEGVETMPSFKHSKRSLGKLMRNSIVRSYSVYTDNFGGRKRLFLQFLK